MRKRFVTATPATVQARGEGWFDLEHAAAVEVTSEDKDFPIESALSIERGQGWRAAEPGAPTIRLVFDEPQELKRISLVFEEDEQWNFSAPTSTREIEDYRVELSEVTLFELTIVPNISGGVARASLKSLRVC